jgi:hypothetical protein
MEDVIKLSKGYNFGGKPITEINLDFDSLTGTDLMNAEKAYKMRNKASVVKELEDGWLVSVAEKASNLKYGDFLKLSGRDYLKVLNKVRGFLTDSDSTENTEKTEKEETEAQSDETQTEE